MEAEKRLACVWYTAAYILVLVRPLSHNLSIQISVRRGGGKLQVAGSQSCSRLEGPAEQD